MFGSLKRIFSQSWGNIASARAFDLSRWQEVLSTSIWRREQRESTFLDIKKAAEVEGIVAYSQEETA